MGRLLLPVVLAVWCWAACALALQPQQSQSCVGDAGCMYQRPPAQPQLHLDHPRLARPASAGPHTPEQVHLAFAGPGGYAVTWLTHPMDEAGLAAAAEEAVDEADAAAAAAGGGAVADGPAAGGEEPYLAAAGPQPHLEAQKAAAAAEANADAATGEEGEEEGGDKGSEAGAANRKKHKKKKKHRRKRRRCSHVVAAGGRSVVQYGMQPGDYPFTVESREPVACYSSGAYVSGAIHRVKIGVGTEGPLPPNTTVYYRCGDPERGWSQEFSFVTAPLVGVAALPYRLGLIGDLGQTDHSMSTLDHVTVTDPASIILTGDLSYADGYQPRWDSWQRLVAPFTSRQVWMYCVGNHEIELSGGKEGFDAYLTRFFFPYRPSLSGTKLYYSYDVAGAHVVMLGSYVAYDQASPQYAWLLRDLAAVDRSRTPWVVAVQHAPWYNSNYAHQGEGDEMRDSMEALLYEHGVDFIFSGHVHAYERLHRVFRGKLDACAPTHINIGDGGNKEGPDKKYYPQPRYSAYREPSFGHGTLDLLDGTRAEWRWHRNQDDGPDSADWVSVVRDPDCQAKRAAVLAALRQEQAAAAAARGAEQAQARQPAQQQADQQAGQQAGQHIGVWAWLRRWVWSGAGRAGGLAL